MHTLYIIYTHACYSLLIKHGLLDNTPFHSMIRPANEASMALYCHFPAVLVINEEA